MKQSSFFFLLLSLFFLGAGCTPSPVKPVEIKFEPTEEASIQETETEAEIQTSQNNAETQTPMTQAWKFPGKLPEEQIKNKQVTLKTDKGNIVFELFDTTAPLTVSNFVYLATNGYYNNLTFHRREEGFVIQGGDPQGNGTGGPGYKFEDELKDNYEYDRGIVAMANSGPNTNGSQFFIMLKDTPLPKFYSIFGKVISGIEVVDKIKIGDKMKEVLVEEKKK